MKDDNELFEVLNVVWGEQLSNCCKLPCTDPVCRQGCVDDGGCQGAELAEKIQTATDRLKAVRSVVEKHRGAVAEPYCTPGGSKEILKSFFRDIERVLD